VRFARARARARARRRGIVCSAALLLGFVPGVALRAQAAQDLEPFLRELESAGSRFADVSQAIAEGYRKLGPDFPGMGEHWINPRLVVAGNVDPAHPPVITYTRVGAQRRLLGFAYTRVLGPGDAPPDGPFPKDAWHDHTESVGEESLLLSGPASVHQSGDGFRVSMVHIWLPARNPAGLLAQNNWALPFLRVGVASPPRPSSSAARALSLGTEEGTSFYDELLREGVRLEGTQLELARSAFQEAARAARARLEQVVREGRATSEDVRAFEEIWTGLWTRLDRTLSSASLGAMASLRS
jgi:hypothetical protein